MASRASPFVRAMLFEAFQESIARDKHPPEGLSGALQALWHDARGDWEGAHECAQKDASAAGAWVHAYLHRKEGDLGNASYWYSRSGHAPPPPAVSLESEWAAIARALLERSSAHRRSQGT
jgi:hypothetical protein